MSDVCEKHGVKLLTYGTLVSTAGPPYFTNLHLLQCGGFLSDQWLDKPEPDLYADNLTPSQRKVRRPFHLHSSANSTPPRLNQYLDMIVKAWGSWPLFQELLTVLRGIGNRHGGVSIANVATRWVLDQPAVGAILIGQWCHSFRRS